MAVPWWRHCRRWSTSCASTGLLETLWHMNGRSVSVCASLPAGSPGSSRPGGEDTWIAADEQYGGILQRFCGVLYTGLLTSMRFQGQTSRQPTHLKPQTLHFTSSLTRHRSWLLEPTLRSCCCRKIHSEAKLKDPFTLAKKDMKSLYDDIRKELFVSKEEMKYLCEYYFDGKGKAIRPMIVVLMARALNIHSNRAGDLLPGQRTVAMISEMIHTASLVHDDVIDDSDQRRGKRTINEIWGEQKAILAGDFILSTASVILARIGNLAVVKTFSEVIDDLVRGEFMQLGSKENENERFKHYLEKTFKKTASLIANSCKAVSILVTSDPELHEIAYQYGKNVGIAFQLVDDVLDFTSGASHLGKPSAADLKLGLATGPVLFACQQFPELDTMIMRRFSSKGDVDRAWQYVLQSDGVQQTNYLAQQYCQEAIAQVSRLRPSAERDALIRLTELVLTRDK